MKAKISRSFVFWVLALVLAGGLCALYVSRANPTPSVGFKREPPGPSQVVQTYWELATTARIEEAHRLETNTDGRVIADLSAYPSTPKSIYESNQQLIRILSEKVKGNRAQVLAEVRNNNGTIRTEQTNLYREKGEWKIFASYSVDPVYCKHLPYMCNFIEE